MDTPLFTVYETNNGIVIEVITQKGLRVKIDKPTVSMEEFKETLEFIGTLIPKG